MAGTTDRRALVVEAKVDRGSLAGVRALAAAGWRISVASSDPLSLAGSSRHCDRWHLTPAAEANLDGFIAKIAAIVAAEGIEVVLCGGGDAEMMAVSKERHRIGCRVPLTPHDELTAGIDKLGLAEAAASAGLRGPRTTRADRASIDAVDAPTIVKARLHAPDLGQTGPSRLPAKTGSNPDEVRQLATEIEGQGGEAILQQRIAGSLMAYSSVRAPTGEIVAELQQLSKHTWPPNHGVSSSSTTVPVDRELAGGVAKLLENLGWIGISQLQFLLATDGIPYLIDLNGRFYGSLALAEASGVNLAAAWADCGSDDGPRIQPAARPDTWYVWAEGDLRRALRERRGGIVRDLLRTLRILATSAHSVWRMSDLAPSLRSLQRLPSRLLSRD